MGIEVASRLRMDVGERLLQAARRVIWPGGGHRIINIDDSKDTGDKWNLLTFQTTRVAAAVPPFMVVVRNVQAGAQVLHRR